ncbi:hypothetical protein U1Q18_032443 [Sarracenia purpurea var. burkii]
MNVELSPSHVSYLMGIPRIPNPQYPFNEYVGPIDSKINQELTNDAHYLLTNLTQDLLSPPYCNCHKIVSSIIAPTSCVTDIPRSRALFLYAIGKGYSCDLACIIWLEITQLVDGHFGSTGIPLRYLIMSICTEDPILLYDNEPITPHPKDLWG